MTTTDRTLKVRPEVKEPCKCFQTHGNSPCDCDCHVWIRGYEEALRTQKESERWRREAIKSE